MLVSVIIPCFNHGHYLAAAIASVLAQTHPHVEVVVVDDGSTDDTAAVAARFPSVRYLRQANQGLAVTRNAGLTASAGEFVVFLDADDVLFADAVAAGLRCMVDHPDCSFVYGGCAIVSDDLAPITHQVPVPAHANYLSFLRASPISNPASVLYRRADLELAGGFDTTLPAPGCEDYDLYLRMAQLGPVASHEGLVVKYRQHSTNMSGDLSRMLRSVRAVLRRHKPRRPAGNDARASWRHGWIRYQQFYGIPLLHQAFRELRQPGGRMTGARTLGGVLRFAPWAPVFLVFDGRARSLALRLERHVPAGVCRTIRRVVGRTHADAAK